MIDKEYQNTPMWLQGDALQGLQKYNNRPVDVWGVLDFDKNGSLAIKAARHEIPYPDL